MRLIDADALTKYFFRPYSNEESYSNTDIRNVIDKQPSIEPDSDTISRQQAVEVAMQYCLDDDGSCSKADRDIRELLDDLENLPPSPTVTADTDTISRQMALDAVLNLNVENRVSWLDAVIDTIDALPHSPSRREGKWLASDDMYETGICSCCRWDSREPFDYAIANFHFCPNCGADMREEND